MTKHQLLAYLRTHRDVLNISCIGTKIGIGRRLCDIVAERKDGHDRLHTLSDKHVPALAAEIEKLIPSPSK